MLWVDIFLEEIFFKELPIHSFEENFLGNLARTISKLVVLQIHHVTRRVEPAPPLAVVTFPGIFATAFLLIFPLLRMDTAKNARSQNQYILNTRSDQRKAKSERRTLILTAVKAAV